MQTLYKYVSMAGLGLMLLASILVFNGQMEQETYHKLALLGTVMWFVPVPFWMKRRLHHSE